MSLGDFARSLIPSRPAAPVALEQVAVPAAALLPAPSRFVEGRVEFRGMLWKPVIGLAERPLQVVSAKAGLPHCAFCEKSLSLAGGRDWSCGSCAKTSPGADVDFFAMDCVIAEALSGFLRDHPEYSPAPGLSVPARALQTAA